MTILNAEKLFDLELFGRPNSLGRTTHGQRRFVQVSGGSFRGVRLKGQVMPVGADIALIRDDNVFETNVHMLMNTDDQEMIYMSYTGRFHGPSGFIERLVNRDPTIQQGDFYLWNAVFFETSAEKYRWLNGILAVSTGLPLPKSERGIGMKYEVFELL
jgi:hypothetical protein